MSVHLLWQHKQYHNPLEIAIEKSNNSEGNNNAGASLRGNSGQYLPGLFFRCFLLRYQRTEQLDDAAQINNFHYDPSLSYTAFDSRNMGTNQGVLESGVYGDNERIADVSDILKRR
jgi:hypothetical protein